MRASKEVTNTPFNLDSNNHPLVSLQDVGGPLSHNRDTISWSFDGFRMWGSFSGSLTPPKRQLAHLSQ